MPATGPWLCLTDPADIKCVFTADTGVLRLGAALAKASAHHLFLGPTGLTNIDGVEHMRSRRMQLPPFHGDALGGYHETMQRKAEEALARWPYGHPTPS
jgi:cytochrome P450